MPFRVCGAMKGCQHDQMGKVLCAALPFIMMGVMNVCPWCPGGFYGALGSVIEVIDS